MFEMASSSKRIQIPGLQGIIGKSLLPIWLLFNCALGSTPECCRHNETWINDSKNCTDGSKLQLQCSHGFYMIHPQSEPNERFTVIPRDNVSWLSIDDLEDNSSYNISPGSFCLGKSGKTGDDQIALICFPEQFSEFRPVWRDICFGLFSMLSSVFLALTLLVYLILPEMREIQDKAIMSMTASFMIAFFLTGNQQLNSPPLNDEITCLFTAFIMYYAYMCAFFWMNIISFNIWRSVWFPCYKIRCDILFMIYCTIGWGLPLCFLAASVVAHHVEGYHLKPGFGESNCWFNGFYATWTYFYGPIMVLLLANLLYLGLTSWKLWHEYKDVDSCKFKVLRFKCLMYIKLAVIMGFTWIFEIVSFAAGERNQLYWIIPDISNALQGLFIFILLVVFRKRVRKLLAKKRPFNIPFPKSWAAYADEEVCQPVVGQEELELSQSS